MSTVAAGRGGGGEGGGVLDSMVQGRVAARDASLLLAGSRAHELTTLCIGCHFGERQILHMSLAAVWADRDGDSDCVCERERRLTD